MLRRLFSRESEAARRLAEEVELLHNSPLVDPVWYRQTYADLRDTPVDVARHYLEYGSAEGRNPGPLFDTEFYLQRNPDVIASGMNPLVHYILHGQKQGRQPRRELNENFDRPIQYDSEYQPNESFAGFDTDIKAIAFYLPQFHVCKQNNEWWGDGFTEWTNTQKSKPRFPGHYQPREPHTDIGYYDLADLQSIEKQVELARSHGIHGFCFYYYWFSGEKILEKPIELLLRHPEIDISFCLCWANENWTRAWDGMSHDVLIEQKYLDSDAGQFIRDISPYFVDGRYIRVDNKPVLIVYKPHIIPNVGDVFEAWRRAWREISGGDLLIWCCRTDPRDLGMETLSAKIDAVVEFPPHVIPYSTQSMPYLLDQKNWGLNTSGNFFDYRSVVADIVSGLEQSKKPFHHFYRSVMLGWDNSARRQDGWSVWYGFSLDHYDKWLRHVISVTREIFPEDRRFIFINAWNEWAEGAYLEPDKAYGYANINTTSRAIFDLPERSIPRVLGASPSYLHPHCGTIAVHLHIYFEKEAEELLNYVNHIPHKFDLYVTTDTRDKARMLAQLFKERGRQNYLSVIQTHNLGRDSGPFLVEIISKLKSYDFIGHFHTKKSLTVDWGDRWRTFLLDNLLGSEDGVRAIFETFAREPKLGVVCPPAYPLIAPHVNWGGVEDRCRDLLRQMGCDIHKPEPPNFPVGNMFWARTAAIRPISDRRWSWNEFEPEEGQVGQTLAHCVERIWCYVATSLGYDTSEILLKHVSPRLSQKSPDFPIKRPCRLAFFVHYDERNVADEADLFYVRKLKELVDDIIVVSNSVLPVRELDKFRHYATNVFQRSNLGLDFGAWRDCIERMGWSKLTSYDEIVFANNSCYGPVFPICEMFTAMAEKSCDFWGITAFPEAKNSPRPEAELLPNRHIPEHLQSYFLVFKKRVVQSDKFKEFWKSVENKQDFMKVVTSYEVQLTRVLSSAGFRWDCYVPESVVLQESQNHVPRFNVAYNKPAEMILLRDPLIKKKASSYAPAEVVKVQNLVRSFGYYPPHLLFEQHGS